jgi:hypothetical protein
MSKQTDILTAKPTILINENTLFLRRFRRAIFR